MESHLKTMLLTALLICISVVNASPIDYSEVENNAERFCALPYEQKGIAVTCVISHYPPKLVEILKACTPTEDVNEANLLWVDSFSYNCDREEYQSSLGNEFLECCNRKMREQTVSLDEKQVQEFGNSISTITYKCINEAENS